MMLMAVLGFLVGSFLNVCIHRLPREESIVLPPSHCPACRHVLGAMELIPVVSYLIQRGKCKNCGVSISARYPAVEILTAGIFVICKLLFFSRGDYADGFVFLYFFCSLIVITFIDIDHELILDVVTYPGMALGLIFSLWGHAPLSGHTPVLRLLESAEGLAVGGGTLWAIQFLGNLWYRRESLTAMGLGDVKMAAFTGAILGPAFESAALLYAVLIGGVAAIALMVTGIKGRKDHIPFGPALAVGAALAPFWGAQLLALYHVRI